MWSPGRGQFWPQRHNLNNLCRAISWCYIPNTNTLGLVASEKKIFEVFNLKIYFSSCDLIMQRTRTVWTTLKEGHQLIIPDKLGDHLWRSLGEEVVWIFLYITLCNPCDPRGGANFDPRGIIWIIFVENHKLMLHTKYQHSRPCGFREEDF